MTSFNTLRDRLMLRLLSKPSQDALSQVVFYDLKDEIKDFICMGPEELAPGVGHVAVGLTHLADLIDPSTDWTAQLTENN